MSRVAVLFHARGDNIERQVHFSCRAHARDLAAVVLRDEFRVKVLGR